MVHGGAGSWSAIHHDHILKEDLEAGVRAAARAGWDKLRSPQSSAVEAVQAAVMSMEADPNFNAGNIVNCCCERERERGREGEKEREGGRESVCV